MPLCDTCGAPLSDDHPFAVCARCLFGQALQADDPVGEAESGAPQPSRLEGGPERSRASSRFAERYEIQTRVARGGQGEIWKVWDFRLRRSVAMKRLTPSAHDPEAAASRFLAEAQIAGQLQHPGILPVHDVGRDFDDLPYYTTDLLPGTTLADLLRSGDHGATLVPSQARQIELLIRVCEIVAHAHSQGVIHRDLKPENVLVGRFGDVRVIDWGSAWIADAAPGRAEARAPEDGPVPGALDGTTAGPRPSGRFGTPRDPGVGPVPPGSGVHEPKRVEARAPGSEPALPVDGVGLPPRIETDRSDHLRREPDSPLATGCAGTPITPMFAPPELIADPGRPPTPGTDVFAVGVMLYEVASGRLPHADVQGRLPPREALGRLLREGRPAPVGSLRSDVPRDLAAIVHKAMAPDPGGRYTDLTQLADDLRAFLELKPVTARPTGVVGSIEMWARRHSRAVLATAAGLALLGVLAGFSLRLDADRRAAVQIQALREIDLDQRHGRWRESIERLEAMETSGYRDAFDLALRRFEAWTVLWEPTRARAALEQLIAVADPSPSRAALARLRQGEFELFDPATFEQGIARVREALGAGLDPTEATFARGILAPSTDEALRHFGETLRSNPFHHGAHRYALGLEMLSGRREELTSHVRVFRGLFPQDPTPAFAEALLAAYAGDRDAADAALAPIQSELPAGTRQMIGLLVTLFASAQPAFDIDHYLGERKAPPFNETEFGARLLPMAFSGLLGKAFGGALSLTSATPDPRAGRLPQLPCVKAGVDPGIQVLLSFVLEATNQFEVRFARLTNAWQAHPEGLIPYGVAVLREARISNPGPESPFLEEQARLLDLAADSRSIMPSLPRLALFRAARAHFELSKRRPEPHAAACRALLRRAAEFPRGGRAEASEYCAMAIHLQELDLASRFLARWEQGAPDPHDRRLLRARIRIELARGAWEPALGRLEAYLALDPTNSWARQQLDTTRAAVRRLADALSSPSTHGARQP